MAVSLSPHGGARRIFCRGPFVVSVLLYFMRGAKACFFSFFSFSRRLFLPLHSSLDQNVPNTSMHAFFSILETRCPPPRGGGGVSLFVHQSQTSENKFNGVLHGWRYVVLRARVFCVWAVLALHVAHFAGSMRVLPLRCFRRADEKTCVVMSDDTSLSPAFHLATQLHVPAVGKAMAAVVAVPKT